ncbi:hypothetical protein DsansV1_C11g0106901 [Dioscorea sansibarensis]
MILLNQCQANKTRKMIDIEPEPEVSIPSEMNAQSNQSKWIPPRLPTGDNQQTMPSHEDGEDDEARAIKPVAEMENSFNSNSNTSQVLETEQR